MCSVADCQGNVEEFTAYRILYYIYMSSASAITVLLAALADSPLTRGAAVQHALQVLLHF